jgi:toxin FitB
MTGYLLHTNVVSELRKMRPHGGVVAWVKELRAEQLYLSTVTMGELQAGVERIRHHDSSKAEEIEAWVDQ